MKKNIAIIGASYLQLPLIEKAKEMGYKTHVFAWAANDVGEAAADVFYPISITEKERILNVCRQLDVCGICSIASDLAVLTVNYIAEQLGLPGNSMKSSLKCTNKHQMRMAFEAGGDPSPRSILADSETGLQDLALSYPVIVKPTDRSGSRGICKCESVGELGLALRVATAESFEGKALIEEFVEGTEYSVEYISYQGKHFFLAMTEKRTTGAPHFIETGHLEPAIIDAATLERVKAVVSHALDTLEIVNGASHTEVKISDDGAITLIEIGARMGGDCIGSDLVRYSTGFDFVRMVIRVACGQSPDFSRVSDGFPVESIFIFSQADIEELERLKSEQPDKLLKIVDYHPENINQITSSSNRAGCYIRKC